jgi:hypothetical protein
MEHWPKFVDFNKRKNTHKTLDRCENTGYIWSNNTHIFVGQNGDQSNACLLSVLTLKCWKEPSSENVFVSFPPDLRCSIRILNFVVHFCFDFPVLHTNQHYKDVSCFKIYIIYEKSVEKKQYFSHAKCFVNLSQLIDNWVVCQLPFSDFRWACLPNKLPTRISHP